MFKCIILITYSCLVALALNMCFSVLSAYYIFQLVSTSCNIVGFVSCCQLSCPSTFSNHGHIKWHLMVWLPLQKHILQPQSLPCCWFWSLDICWNFFFFSISSNAISCAFFIVPNSGTQHHRGSEPDSSSSQMIFTWISHFFFCKCLGNKK